MKNSQNIPEEAKKELRQKKGPLRRCRTSQSTGTSIAPVNPASRRYGTVGPNGK
jgi:hypothetical protein